MMPSAGLVQDVFPSTMTKAGATLEDIFRSHHDYVWGVARSLGATPDEADDVVQDVFLVVRRRLRDYDAQRSARPWLAGIARRVLADHRKKRRRANAREARADGPVPPQSPEPKVMAHERAHAVARFLDELPPEQREVFVLCVIEGMSTREVARLTGAKPNTVSSRLRLARKRFSARAEELKREEERAHAG